jgi:guanylate kinase
MPSLPVIFTELGKYFYTFWVEDGRLIYFFINCSKKAVRDVQDQNRICMLDIDIEGVKNLKKTDFNPLYIFVMPPNVEVLVCFCHRYWFRFVLFAIDLMLNDCLFRLIRPQESRLRQRGSETEENIKRRLLRAAEETVYGEVEGNFDILIVNDNFEEAYTKLRLFVESHYSVERVHIEPIESRTAPSAQN